MSSLNGKKNEPDKHVKYDGIPYLRIGTEYFKIIQQPLSSGDKDRKIIPWNKTVVDEDHGKTYRLNRIPKYDSFCLIPDHLNYKSRKYFVRNTSIEIILVLFCCSVSP